MISRHVRAAFAFISVICVASLAQAQLTFSFTYSDAAGTGFNDNTLGATRQAALQSAASTLASYFTGYNVNVSFDVVSENVANSTLAFAGSGVSYSGNGFYHTIVQNLIQTGSGTSDGTITFNFGQTWDYTDSVASNAYDFKSTAMHEMLHALGFLSGVSSTGTGFANNASGTGDVWTTFDKFLVTNAGASLIDGSSFAFQQPLSVLTGGSANGTFFGGANAMAAYGGYVPLYSPNPWEDGSSISHTDDTTFTGANALLMNAATGTGQGIRTLSAVELGILTDLGYHVSASAVPEPATYALIVGAFGLLLVGFVRRQRRAGAPLELTQTS